MNKQWQDLKEIITEMRDNDGTGTQQEVCNFLVNYMDLLEKQMQKSTLNKVRADIIHLHDWAFCRDEVIRIIDKYREKNTKQEMTREEAFKRCEEFDKCAKECPGYEFCYRDAEDEDE